MEVPDRDLATFAPTAARPERPVPLHSKEDKRPARKDESAKKAGTIDSPVLRLDAAEPTGTTRQAAMAATGKSQPKPLHPSSDPQVIATLYAPFEGTEQPLTAGRVAKSSIAIATSKGGSSTPLEEAAPQDTPTVQVTIGRIEVRATPAVDRPTSAGKAPSVMGLDEYLKRRGRGEGT